MFELQKYCFKNNEQKSFQACGHVEGENTELVKIEVILQDKVLHPYSSTDLQIARFCLETHGF